jgi:RimJ/RimL family protein N-acetyltransferase
MMLQTTRIRLRPIEREDLPRYVTWFSDPEVRQYLARYLPLSMAGEEKWFEQVLTRPEDEQPLAIDLHTGEGTWRHIGGAGYHNIDWRNHSAEVGIAIGEKTLWNQGLGTDVMETLLRHAFETLNLHRLFLRVYADNRRAQGAYIKAGFILEGRMRQAEFREGAYQDVLLYSVLRDEWRLRAAAQAGR